MEGIQDMTRRNLEDEWKTYRGLMEGVAQKYVLNQIPRNEWKESQD
jgi:hypothetical protein